MAASRPAIDPDEGLAALFQRAHVGARRASSLLLQPQLQDLENVYDLLEAVRSGASAASLGISARDFERICDCALPALRSAEAAAAALALFACPSSHDGPSGLAAGGQAGGSAAAGGARGLGAEGSEGYTSGEEEAAAAAASSSEEQFGPRLPAARAGTSAAVVDGEEGRRLAAEAAAATAPCARSAAPAGAQAAEAGLTIGSDPMEEEFPGGAAPAEGEESGAVSPDCSREVHIASLFEGEASMTARIEPLDLESRAAGAQVSSSPSADHPEHESWRRRGGAAWWRAHWAQLNVGQWLGVVEPCCLCGRPGMAGRYTGRCAAPYLATTDDRWEVPGLRQAYVAHGMCGGLCRGWGCCEARGVAQPQDGSGEARGEGEGEGELSSDGDSDRSAGDPVWGSAALEDEWRAASLARQAVGDAAYAAAHAAGASRAEACDAAVRAVRLDEVEAQSSFLVRAGWYGSGRDGGGEGAGATAARNRRRRGARARAKEEEPEPGEDWEGEERPEEYAGLFDDP